MVSIQWLRALAVTMVIVFHVLLKAHILGFTELTFSQGAAGVDLFFIISGFIMIYITRGRDFAFFDFMTRRVMRIIPFYWLVSGVVCVVYLYNPNLVNSHNGETHLLSSLLLLPIQDKVMLLEVGWTLRYEFLFYISFAFSALLFRNPLNYCVISIVVITITSLIKINNFYVQYFTNPLMLEFLFGITLYYLLNKTTKIIGFISLTLGVAMLIFFGFSGYGLQNRVIYYGLPMFLISLGLISFEDIIKSSKKRASQFISYLGDASYSLYLTHTLVIGVVAKISTLFNVSLAPYLFVPLSVITSVIVGLMSYELIEKPMVRFMKNLNLGPNAATSH
ncbi:acyltransferase [Erwinia psidii]|uniref:acyltransferase family protein n=1 Tax=Erwinia psidii TaxID=69224 RepID=UPI00226B6869|nr:acyltransferase [Erwinia psidii]MCX8957235.1 acyltransferase [Erwinia psidii]